MGFLPPNTVLSAWKSSFSHIVTIKITARTDSGIRSNTPPSSKTAANIKKLEKSELLPGVENFLKQARAAGIKIALGSASKNSPLILDRLGITELFDAVVDGTRVNRAKPDPEVFVTGAEDLGIDPEYCVVFEDAVAGVQAAHNAGMKAVGIGSPEILGQAELVIPGFANVTVNDLLQKLENV